MIHRGGKFAEIAEKTYAISRFLAKILPVPISPKLFVIKLSAILPPLYTVFYSIEKHLKKNPITFCSNLTFFVRGINKVDSKCS
jgi:hypothetical protein